jgi:hypothetical protein
VLAEVWQQPPPKMKTLIAGPLGVLAEVRQQPPPKMKTSMVDPLTSIVICSEFYKKDVGSNK